MNDRVVIYHNPRCSKSRETLALLQQQGIEPQIIPYMDAPPDSDTLDKLLRMLGFIHARDLMRRNEALYKELNLADETLSDAQLIEAMATHPKLIERPIVVVDGQARLGRPPENVLAILPQK
ncbi:arsenate reductase (glutaredoxin) [Lonsdalea populi]|uniref:Arsenate reductase n=1 Tax=Lonsdalea populi TaxID=1172565 RepID=A0A3N0UM60_9GAMM|nr:MULTISPECIES: arsenate reductase (glutaredoxin) [Lonsdalea]RAT17506.1 arsenate reductase (glutaredoxin) [Lonsdalea quercina]RAT30088.1 arsenate reductase (glutaredoxin) [Lonsdalea populi]RAT37985.1 arsenate reductase (glutaredoxin) [Lonsdalea populi]RAT48424.1 arsenate reductase (glutaredoxin) [Lonsdalea populi]RAT53415.1 arsenate reductase (glutaredoxin) [Lonsdalea populi]